MRIRRRGLTLIELLVAVAILAFCLSGISMTYINMFLMSDLARDSTLATNAVQAKMEEIKTQAFANLTAQAGTFVITDYGYPYASGQSTGRVDVQTNFGNYTSDLTRVRVRACFQSRQRTIGSDLINCTSSPIEVTTLISN